MSTIAENIAAIRARIDAAARTTGRTGADITLVAATKMNDAARVREAGGLFIVGTERHESRRIDNQLRGRAGRQGDPGETRFYLSLEDDIMRLFGLGKTQVRRFALTHGVRTKRIHGNRLYYLKADWDAARKEAERKSASTKAKREE